MRKMLLLCLSLLILAGAGVGAWFAARSPLFLIQVVEVVDHPEKAPVDAQTITRLAGVPAGKMNLFELDLDLVEQRILAESWVHHVLIQKRFPQTLSIAVTFRSPLAVVQAANNSLAYVDEEGKVFGKVDLVLQPDLPLLSGFVGDDQYRVLDAVHLLRAWDASPVAEMAEVSSINWDAERGFRLLITYALNGKRARTMADLGQESDAELEQQLKRLAKVILYLSQNSIASRQIWADAGKKIVVKTAKGS